MKPHTPIRGLLPLFRLHAWGLPAIVGLGLLQSLSEGVGIGLFIPLLTGLLAGPHTPGKGQWLVDTMDGLFRGVAPERRLPAILVCLFVAVLAAAMLGYINNVLFAWVDGDIAHDLRRRTFRQLLTMDFGAIERDRAGRLLNIVASDTWRTSDALNALVHLTITCCTVAVYVALLLLMSWRLTLLVAGGMSLISGIVALLTRSVRSLGEQAKESNAELADRMIEGIDGMQVIRAFGQEAREQARFDSTSNRVRSMMLRMNRLDGVVHPVHEVLAALLLLTMLILAAPTARDVSLLLVFAFVLYRLQPRVKALDAARVRLAALWPSVEEVTAFIDTLDKPRVRSGTRTDIALDRDIVFDRVSFQYDAADAPALSEASFTIPAGATTALVGPSGGGKSTVVKLLLRFYEAGAGDITIGGSPIHEYDLAAWRGPIAFVSQDVYLFNATVAENIAYGRPDASRDQIVAAARMADAHDFIERLPNGYDTVLGHRGMRLSGGQQQRISLARAMIRNPRILILDEATNALDSISEHWIQETVDKLRGDRTVILIAHRLSTIERADQIVVLERGVVRERGTLAALIAQDGLFARLYELQYRRALVEKS